MRTEKVGTVSAAVKDSAEDSPRRASSGHYSRSPVSVLSVAKKATERRRFFVSNHAAQTQGKSPSVGRAVLCTPGVWRPQESSPYNFSAVKDRSTEYLRLTQPPLHALFLTSPCVGD